MVGGRLKSYLGNDAKETVSSQDMLEELNEPKRGMKRVGGFVSWKQSFWPP